MVRHSSVPAPICAAPLLGFRPVAPLSELITAMVFLALLACLHETRPGLDTRGEGATGLARSRSTGLTEAAKRLWRFREKQGPARGFRFRGFARSGCRLRRFVSSNVRDGWGPLVEDPPSTRALSLSGGSATETCARSRVTECEHNVRTTSAPTRTRTDLQSRKPLTQPENASTESDAWRSPSRGRGRIPSSREAGARSYPRSKVRTSPQDVHTCFLPLAPDSTLPASRCETHPSKE